MLTPAFVLCLLRGYFSLALVVFLLASASDALDGFLARRLHLATRLGAVLDPLADKLLVGFGILTLAWIGVLPWWLAAVVVLRDILIVVGAVAFLLYTGELEMMPLTSSKLNTGIQCLLVLLVVASLSGIVPTVLWNPWLIWLALFTTLLSGAQYVWIWARRAVVETRIIH